MVDTPVSISPLLYAEILSKHGGIHRCQARKGNCADGESTRQRESRMGCRSPDFSR
jgi:hypothetical protein